MPPQTGGLALLLLFSSSLVCAVEAAHNGKQTHVLTSCGTGRLPTPVKSGFLSTVILVTLHHCRQGTSASYRLPLETHICCFVQAPVTYLKETHWQVYVEKWNIIFGMQHFGNRLQLARLVLKQI